MKRSALITFAFALLVAALVGTVVHGWAQDCQRAGGVMKNVRAEGYVCKIPARK